MLNFLPHEQTVGMTIGCLLFYIFIFYLLRPAKSYPYNLAKTNYNTAIVFVLIFCLFFFSVSDWFGYFKAFLTAADGGETHMESVYEWLAKSVAPYYIVWRLIVWGAAFTIFLLCIKRLPIPQSLTLLVFVVMMLLKFAYTRTSLAHSLMFFGCILLYVHNKKLHLFSSIIGIVCIGCSYFFHKSALFGIVMIVLGFVIKKINWKTILVFVISLPILIFLLRSQVADYLMMDIASEEEGLNSYLLAGQGYVNQENGLRGIGTVINDLFSRLPILIMAFVCLLQCNNLNIPKEIRLLMRINVLMVIGSLICLIDLGANTYILYYRFLNFAAMPSVFCFSYLYSNRYYPKLLNIVYYIALFGALYSLTYVVYDRFVSGPKFFGF